MARKAFSKLTKRGQRRRILEAHKRGMDWKAMSLLSGLPEEDIKDIVRGRYMRPPKHK